VPNRTGRKRPDLAERNRRPRPDVAARNRGTGVRLYEDAEWCRARYFDDLKSFQEMADEAGCGLRTIARWFKEHGFVAPSHIKRREMRGNTLRGERSPRWRGGPKACICGRPKALVAGTCFRCRDQRGENNGRWAGDAIGYEQAHARVQRVHGAATSHTCVLCANPADHWAYDRADPDEKYGGKSGRAPYSLDISHYRPMCVSCHKRFDLTFLASRKAKQ